MEDRLISLYPSPNLLRLAKGLVHVPSLSAIHLREGQDRVRAAGGGVGGACHVSALRDWAKSCQIPSA